MSQVTQPNFLDCHITANNVLVDAWKCLPSVFVDDRTRGGVVDIQQHEHEPFALGHTKIGKRPPSHFDQREGLVNDPSTYRTYRSCGISLSFHRRLFRRHLLGNRHSHGVTGVIFDQDSLRGHFDNNKWRRLGCPR